MTSLIELVVVPESLPHWELPLLLVVAKSGVILLLALLVTQLLRGAPAALRHLVLSLALAAVLALPVLSTVLPLWRVPLIPGSLPGPVAEITPIFVAAEAPTITIGVPAVLPDELSLPEARADGATVPQAAHATSGSAEAPRPVQIPWLALLVYGWLAGAALLLLRLAAGMLRLRVLARCAEPITDPDWAGLAARLADQLELDRPVPLRRAASDVVPMVWGVFRPVILLPASADAWTDERRAVVLLHEMAHIKRRDPLAHLVAQLCHALHWVNPLVWIAVRRLRDERERACDDHVLATGADPTEYANHLLQIVRTFGMGRAAAPALAMARRSQFEGRMLAILDPGLRRGRISRATASVAGVAALLATVPLAAVAPADATHVDASAARQEAPDGDAMAAADVAPLDSVPLQARAIAAQYRIPEDLARAIVVAAHAERLDLGLAVLLVRTESNFQEDRISPRGAVGLTQILPSTAASLEPGVSRAALAQRETNLRLGFRYLRLLLDRYHGDAAAALTAYHTGPGATDRMRQAGIATVPPTDASSAAAVSSATPAERATSSDTAGKAASQTVSQPPVDAVSADGRASRHAVQKPPVPTPTHTRSGDGWTTELFATHEAGHVTTRVNVWARDVILRSDGTCVDSILAGGRLVIEEIGPAATRSITVTPAAGGELQYRYAVGGVVQPYDAAAETWFSQRIQQLHRQLKGQTRI